MHASTPSASSPPGEKLDYRACEALEEVFKRLQFKVVDLEQTNLDEDVSGSCHHPDLLPELPGPLEDYLGGGRCRRRPGLGQRLGFLRDKMRRSSVTRVGGGMGLREGTSQIYPKGQRSGGPGLRGGLLPLKPFQDHPTPGITAPAGENLRNFWKWSPR